MKPIAAALVFSAFCIIGLSVQAQAIYRCGSTYSQAPCPDGKVIESSDPRSAADRAAARAVVANERRLGAEMERERLLQAATTRPALAASLSAAPARPVVAVVKANRKKNVVVERDFIAVARNGR